MNKEFPYNFIVIEGNIGAGKTTLATRMAEEYNSRLILEQFADNPFLPKFYEDPEKHAFPLELSFLAERYHQLKTELSSHDLFQKGIIADYYFAKSLIFAKSNLKQDEFELYTRLFHIIHDSLPKPDLFVYLYHDISRLQQNIRKRGRVYEQNITDEYLAKIQTAYFDFLKQVPEQRILIIDVNTLDYANNDGDYDLLVEILFKQHPSGISYVKAGTNDKKPF